MTRFEAFEKSATTGCAIKHRFFSEEEFITINPYNKIITDDGYRFSIDEFLKYRNSKEWETDWEVIEL